MTRVIEKVGLLVLPRVIAMDFSIAAHVLGGHPGFELLVAGHAGYAGAEDGVSIVPSHPLTVVDDADVVVVPGFGLSTAANLRISLRRETGLLPSDYRRSHRRATTAPLRTARSDLREMS